MGLHDIKKKRRRHFEKTAVLYLYVKPENKEFLRELADEKGYCLSELVDEWIESERLGDVSPVRKKRG